jgi:hypothetical protein
MKRLFRFAVIVVAAVPLAVFFTSAALVAAAMELYDGDRKR